MCSFIPGGSLASGQSAATSELTASRSLTPPPLEKLPTERSAVSSFSHQAKDLAPSKQSATDPVQTASRSEVVLNHTSQKALPESPGIVANRCWRSLSANCTYTTSRIRIGATSQPPAQGEEVAQAEPSSPDAELGDLRITPAPDPELGDLKVQPIAADPPVGASDPELGTLRIQERTVPEIPIALPNRPRQPSAYLLLRTDYFNSSNVFSDVEPISDGLLRTGLTFFYAPPIGSKTFLITSFDANLIRYGRLGQYRSINGSIESLNYDELRLRAGIFHRITPRLSGEIGWSNQKLFTSARGLQQFFSGREFFGDNSFRVELSRQDTLSPRLSLNTYYQFRWSFANPDDRSRILNSLITTLGYSVSQKLQVAIDYQFTWSHFTQQARDDLYHQLLGRVTYNLTPRTQVNLFSGFSFGHSSDQRIDFNGFLFGAGIVFSLPLF
ncbi:hypothetical protein [Leptolyngbya sp. FACHB-17]|uniref:hypothetical protein n=1 Tax=unclassified Leptolyngbya TaxID=2650499 RepID=UPI001681AFEB|nr:hypothetical protein [Leptolyngbya sp. FACHB-17]